MLEPVCWLKWCLGERMLQKTLNSKDAKLSTIWWIAMDFKFVYLLYMILQCWMLRIGSCVCRSGDPHSLFHIFDKLLSYSILVLPVFSFAHATQLLIFVWLDLAKIPKQKRASYRPTTAESAWWMTKLNPCSFFYLGHMVGTQVSLFKMSCPKPMQPLLSSRLSGISHWHPSSSYQSQGRFDP